ANAIPDAAAVSTRAWLHSWISSRAPADVYATRYSSVLISFATPTLEARRHYRAGAASRIRRSRHRASCGRRLATVLFLDIVGSTALASELGDARWRELLTRFRRIVRDELKHHGGRSRTPPGTGSSRRSPSRLVRSRALRQLS